MACSIMKYLGVLLVLMCCVVCISAQCTPYDFEIDQITSAELTIVWYCMDYDRPDDYFRVIYRPTNRDQCDTGPGDGDDTGINAGPPFNVQNTTWGLWNRESWFGFTYEYRATIANLFPHSTYRVGVQSMEGDYYGEIVDVDPDQTTLEAEPSGGPENIRANNVTNTSITYDWSEPPCGQRNGVITGYKYTLLKTGSITPLVYNQFTSDTSVTLRELRPDTEYAFIISARTDVGIGPESTFKQQTSGQESTTRVPPPPFLNATADPNPGPNPSSSILGIAVGASAGIVVVVAVVITVIVCVCRRSSSAKDGRCRPPTNDTGRIDASAVGPPLPAFDNKAFLHQPAIKQDSTASTNSYNPYYVEPLPGIPDDDRRRPPAQTVTAMSTDQAQAVGYEKPTPALPIRPPLKTPDHQGVTSDESDYVDLDKTRHEEPYEEPKMVSENSV